MYVDYLFQNTLLKENYSLRNQMERSSGSIMDNIAEGFDRNGNKEFHNFLSYSKVSVGELKSQTYLISNVKNSTKNNFKAKK